PRPGVRKQDFRFDESGSRPRLVLVSDTPSLVEDVKSNFDNFAEVVHFDYESYEGELSGQNGLRSLDFRTKDWGPAPRWVAFVDFFLASRARHAVVSGAHRRVGTTYVQLIAALAAANSAVRALQAAFYCTKKVLQNTQSGSRPRLVLVSDTPSLVEDVKSNFDNFAEVVHFDYESYEGELSGQNGL
nr:hypothetical protein Ccrd_019290 [Tanacetum cinerariifolium]